MLWSII
jgi:hypothetical protein